MVRRCFALCCGASACLRRRGRHRPVVACVITACALLSLANITAPSSILRGRLGSASLEAASESEAASNSHTVIRGCYYYTVCNGFMNQLLCHAGHLAAAVKAERCVMIPDVFIVDGTQTIPDGNVLKNTDPTESSIPFGSVFDAETLLRRVRSYGIEADLTPYERGLHGLLDCSFSDGLRASSSGVAAEILGAMVPAARAHAAVEKVYSALLARVAAPPPAGAGEGVCLHHRDGADWHGHCDQWERLSKWNTNCRNQRPIPELIQHRTSHLGRVWIFYAGDSGVPESLRSMGVPVTNREEVYPSSRHDLASYFTNGSLESLPRDIGAFLDYFLCLRLPHFIGNSVSTWSAGQIAQRASNSSWYNSGFIPLADYLKAAYRVPIVYTYTEDASASVKPMLQASVLSALQHMPGMALHLLYHGSADIGFRDWLEAHGVILHDSPAILARQGRAVKAGGVEG